MNKVILITGASRGIGRECARLLSINGYKVIANYNKSESNVIDLKNELESQGVSIDIYKCDVTNRFEVKEMVNYVINKYDKIDVLINNAGIDNEKMFVNITDDDWNEMIKCNLTSVFYCSQEVIKYMINEKNGSIINISSIYGTHGGSCDVHYSSAKAGINGFTKALAREMSLSNIRVNAIAPGAILTDMTSNISEDDWNEVIKEIPLNKVGKPIDIAKCVKWLIEDEYTTGQVIEVNGGWSM